MTNDNVNSVLSVDFGSVSTRVVLIDIVDGAYRLVARGQGRTTDGYPINDVAVGLDRVLRQVYNATGRRFLAENGTVITPEQADRSGVDLFTMTASVGRPLRAVVVGLTPNVSVESALRAASTNYIDVANIISLDDGRSEEERMNAIVLTYPDVVFLTGGTEAGATEAVLRLARMAALAVSLVDKQRRPAVIYSGNSYLDVQIADLFQDVTTVLFAGNIRPDLRTEKLDTARLKLGEAFDQQAGQRSSTFAMLSKTSQTGALPTPQGYGVLADYLGQTGMGPLAVVDMGSSATTLALYTEGRMQTGINPQIGLGYSAEALLDTVGIEAIRGWLPFNISRKDMRNYVMNKTLRPASIPATVKDLYIEQAMLKAGVRHLLQEMVPGAGALPLNLLIGAGGPLTGTGSAGYDAMLLLDTLQPTGVTVLQNDPYGLIPAMGSIATRAPEVVVQLMDGGSLNYLGVCIAVDGKPPMDKPVLRVTVTPDEGDVTEHDVLGGHIWAFRLPRGRRAEVKIRCRRGTSVNGKRGVKLMVDGGAIGILIDARGRPVPLGKSAADRAMLLPMWAHEVTGDPIVEIDPALLEAIADEDEAEAKPLSRRERRRRRRGKDEAASTDEPSDDELAALFGDDDDDDTSIEDEIDELRNVLS